MGRGGMGVGQGFGGFSWLEGAGLGGRGGWVVEGVLVVGDCGGKVGFGFGSGEAGWQWRLPVQEGEGEEEAAWRWEPPAQDWGEVVGGAAGWWRVQDWC